MKLCRFGDGRLGLVDAAGIRDVTPALDVLPSYRYPLPRHDVLIEHLDAVRARAAAMAASAPLLPLGDVALASPLANPGKLIAAPVNYQKHRDEVRDDPALHQNKPEHTAAIRTAGLFLKATSSLVGPGEGVAVLDPDRRTDHEIELAVVIGRTARRVSRADALACIAGYTIGLDISLRGPEDRSFRKSPDTYSVLGPWLVTSDELGEPGGLEMELFVNGDLRQRSNTRNMILGVAELIELASAFYTLHPGDVVFTGTPEGVGAIRPGDRITARIERIGTMELQVRAAAAPGDLAMTAGASAGR